jgi:tryptophan synthase beta chain
LILQEVSQERWIDIPEAVLEKYLMWRPTPLYRASSLENTSRRLPASISRTRG